jgi:hypothetical protein
MTDLSIKVTLIRPVTGELPSERMVEIPAGTVGNVYDICDSPVNLIHPKWSMRKLKSWSKKNDWQSMPERETIHIEFHVCNSTALVYIDAKDADKYLKQM